MPISFVESDPNLPTSERTLTPGPAHLAVWVNEQPADPDMPAQVLLDRIRSTEPMPAPTLPSMPASSVPPTFALSENAYIRLLTLGAAAGTLDHPESDPLYRLSDLVLPSGRSAVPSATLAMVSSLREALERSRNPVPEGFSRDDLLRFEENLNNSDFVFGMAVAFALSNGVNGTGTFGEEAWAESRRTADRLWPRSTATSSSREISEHDRVLTTLAALRRQLTDSVFVPAARAVLADTPEYTKHAAARQYPELHGSL